MQIHVLITFSFNFDFLFVIKIKYISLADSLDNTKKV